MILTLARSRAVNAASIFFEVYTCDAGMANEPIDLTEETVMKYYDEYAERKKRYTTSPDTKSLLQSMFDNETMTGAIDDEFLSAVKEEVRNIVRGLLATWIVEKKNK